MQIGIIGMGKMGANMARRLLRARYRVVAHDLDQARIGVLVSERAAGVASAMVHNGIEYALMEAYAEGFEIIEASAYGRHLNYRELAQPRNRGGHGGRELDRAAGGGNRGGGPRHRPRAVQTLRFPQERPVLQQDPGGVA